CKANGLIGPAPGIVGIQCQPPTRSNGLTGRTHTRHINLEHGTADLDLKVVKTLSLVRQHLLADVVERAARALISTGGISRNSVSPATQEAIQRQTGDLA